MCKDKEWDKKQVASLIDMLRGDDTIAIFAEKCGIASISISKMKAGEFCPTARMITKLFLGSSVANKEDLTRELYEATGNEQPSGVDYNRVIYAMPSKVEAIIGMSDNCETLSISSGERMKQKYETLNLAGDLKAYCQKEFVAHALLKDAMKGYKYDLINDGLNLADFASTGRYKINDTYEWWFHFIPFDTMADFLRCYNSNQYALIGVLALQGIDANRKITLVTYNKEIFDFILGLPLNVLRADISVVNVSDTDILPKLEQEKFLSSYSGNGEHSYCLTINN